MVATGGRKGSADGGGSVMRIAPLVPDYPNDGRVIAAVLHGAPNPMSDLHNQRIAILVEQGFEQVELTDPKKALEEAGAATDIVSPRATKVRAWNFEEWGDEFTVDVPL